MTDPTPQAILRLFWHRTRKQHVPLTQGEIIRSMKAFPPDAICSVLRSMTKTGYLSVGDVRKIGDLRMYDATQKGNDMIAGNTQR